MSPTIELHTDPGTVLGTVGYMSPGQARGEPGDQRSDLFSLGTVLYELVSGRRAFQRDTAAETLTAILREDPPELTAGSVSGVPPALARVIQHCLAKNPAERFQSASDVAFALENLSAASSPKNAAIGYGALSPDGRRLITRVIEPGGQRRLWIRPLDSLTMQPLPSTEGGERPFWSPDGRFIGFFSGQLIKKLDLVNGGIQVITSVGIGTVACRSAHETALPGGLDPGRLRAQGYLFFARNGALMAQPFDLARLALNGEARLVADDVCYSPVIGFTDFSVSEAGVLAYLSTAVPWRLTCGSGAIWRTSMCPRTASDS